MSSKTKTLDEEGWTILHQWGVWTIKKCETEGSPHLGEVYVCGAIYGRQNVLEAACEYPFELARANENWERHLKESKEFSGLNRYEDFEKCIAFARAMLRTAY